MKKLEIGVCTSVWYEDEHLEESLRFIRDCGFEAIDFSFDRLYNSTLDKEKLTSFYDRSREEREAYFRRVKEAVEKYGLHISQGHGLFPIYVPGDERGNAYRTRSHQLM